MKKESNSKKEKISPDAQEMISGGTGQEFGQFTDIGLPSIWEDPHSKKEKGRLTG